MRNAEDRVVGKFFYRDHAPAGQRMAAGDAGRPGREPDISRNRLPLKLAD
jgi:hypothetical protein